MTTRTPIDRSTDLAPAGRPARPFGGAGACTLPSDEIVTASVPDRLPPASSDRDSPKPTARSSFSSVMPAAACPRRNAPTSWDWRRPGSREGTGAIVADVPVDTPNARAAAASFREIRSVLTAGGVPSRAITLASLPSRRSANACATIRLSYPKITAVAGPCGLWPRGSRTLISTNVGYNENQAVLQFRLRDPAQPCGDDRQSGRISSSRDLRVPPIRRAAISRVREIPQGRNRRRPPIPKPIRPNSAIQANDQPTPVKTQKISSTSRRRMPTITSRPAPRVSVQAFCESDRDRNSARAASEDRRLGKAHLSVHMGGIGRCHRDLPQGADAERHLLEMEASGNTW